MPNKLKYDRRVQGLLFLIVAVMTNFWLSSRYPSLDTKSMMAGSVSLADGLSFDAWIAHDMADSALRDIVITYLNWLHTNQQGMTFGLMIAVLFMTLIPLLRDELDQYLTRRFSATVSGALIGAPLGVCVNCAAPIGYGMYKQGARMEAALATMISSPTMNIVVLSMAFTLFPVYIVTIKIIAALFVIFAVVPFLVSRFPEEAVTREPLEDVAGPSMAAATGGEFYIEKDPAAAIGWLVVALTKQAWIIIKHVVPIMLLAGLLGSAAVVLIPWDLLIGILPTEMSLTSVLMMIALSAFGLALPVPIAFDVILAASLSNAGISMQYIGILLFVLGSFSVYSFMVLLRAQAIKVAVSLAVALIAVGVLSGFATKIAHDFYAQSVEAPLFEQLSDGTPPDTNEMPAGLSGGVYQDEFAQGNPQLQKGLKQQLAAASKPRHLTPALDRVGQLQPPPPITWQRHARNPRVAAFQFAERGPDKSRFSRLAPKRMGLDHHFKPLLFNFINEFPDANGISGGDFNQDGWFDLLFATPNGVYVYMNVGGEFRLHSRLAGSDPQSSFTAGAAAFIDLNNDEQPDVIFSEHRTGLWLSYNRNGKFEKPMRLPDSDGRFSKALAFYDITGNGSLEFFSGHVSSMLALRPSHQSSQNLFYRRDGDNYRVGKLHEPLGETLSIWLSDLDDDKHLDLWVGNDFDEPDMFYRYEEGHFAPVWNNRIEETTRWTMSIDAADIDNDLDMEIYIGQTTWNPSSPPYKIQQGRGIISEQCKKFDGPYCQLSTALAQTRKANKTQDAGLCDTLAEPFRLDCIATVYFRQLRSSITPTADKQAILEKAHVLKQKYPKLHQSFLEMVENDPITLAQSNKQFARFVPQRRGVNVFLVRDEQGRFMNKSVEYGVDIGGWTWNARFNDVDGDEWQDLYVVNGWTPSELETTNVLYRNQEGRGFSNDTADLGLLDFEPTIAYTYIDFDNDGDLDIVSYSQIGRVAVYRNEMHKNQVIQFELRDSQGNHYGVGAKLVIRYGENGKRKQIREIKMSGGHLSFDPKIMHFGLGSWDTVEAVEVRWPTGQPEVLQGPFAAGYRYRITR